MSDFCILEQSFAINRGTYVYRTTVLEPSVRHCVATSNCMGYGSVGIFAYCRISLTVLSAKIRQKAALSKRGTTCLHTRHTAYGFVFKPCHFVEAVEKAVVTNEFVVQAHFLIECAVLCSSPWRVTSSDASHVAVVVLERIMNGTGQRRMDTFLLRRCEISFSWSMEDLCKKRSSCRASKADLINPVQCPMWNCKNYNQALIKKVRYWWI